MTSRRQFIQSTAANAFTAVAGCLLPVASADGQESDRSPERQDPRSPNELISLGVMGVNNRGSRLASGMLKSGGVQIEFICDVDSRAARRVADQVKAIQGKMPKVVSDFRSILDAVTIDALVVAAPNHWHAPATILGCEAGKHVYVEKPCSHTAAEGEWAVAAARKHGCVVQMGTQRRSRPLMIEAIRKIHNGDIGEVHYARTWYNNRRGSIGIGNQITPPSWLDWDTWQGPAEKRNFKDNLVHYNWHWHWNWGNGELGNNGVHALDVARWGLDVTYPSHVTASGTKSRHQDDQETPDTMMASFRFPQNKLITWEGLSWSPNGPYDSRFGISFHGTEGTLVLLDKYYQVLDPKGKEVMRKEGAASDQEHFTDFLEAVRKPRRTNADIEEAHRSTLLCHLGNIAYRTSGALTTDPENGHILNQPNAQALWTRKYSSDWESRLRDIVSSNQAAPPPQS